jgi:ferredoxin
MKTQFSRRGALTRLGGAIAGLFTLSAARAAKAAVQKVLVSSGAPKDYDPSKHKWLMCIDVNKCIGCGLCAEACKKENAVPEGPYFRTWIERYVIPNRNPGRARRAARRWWILPTAACTVFPNLPCRRTKSSIRFSCRSCAISASILALRPGVSGRRDV